MLSIIAFNAVLMPWCLEVWVIENLNTYSPSQFTTGLKWVGEYKEAK